MGEGWDDSTGDREQRRPIYYERRRQDRRRGVDRRGSLRWDPRADEKERRSGIDRRRLIWERYTRQ